MRVIVFFSRRMTLALGLLLSACSPSPSQTPMATRPPPTVSVMAVRKVPITETAEGVGRTQAVEDMDVKARIEGYLVERKFREGADVEKGALLFVIDQAPYRLNVIRSEAELSRAQALATQARLDLARIKKLRGKGMVSQSELDAAVAKAAEARAEVAAKQAALERARLDLAYTEIRAPFAGRIGRSEFSIGEFIDKESDPLATLVMLDPIYVYWKVSEEIPLHYRRRMERLVPESDATVSIRPKLRFPDGSFYERLGHLDFLDNRVDPGTGTQMARAVFPNPDGVLLPGQYVDVVVEIGEPAEKLLIPQAAVRQDRDGYSVIVVGEDEQAEVRRVRMGGRYGTDWIVDMGLSEGERVVYQGLQKVQPGMRVNPLPGESEKPASG